MAITRTAMIDDDGTGTTGTIFNNAWKTEFYNQIDSAIRYTSLTSTSTGLVHNWDPGISGASVIYWQGTAESFITGLVGGTAGQIVIIKNTSVGHVLRLVHGDVASAAVNRFVNLATSGHTMVGRYGWAAYIHDGTFWLLVDHEQGQWITPAFSAADYVGSGGAWTVAAGHVLMCRYRLQGKTLFWSLYVSGSTIAAGATATRALFGFTADASAYFPVTPTFVDSATSGSSYAQHNGTVITFYKTIAGGGFAAGTLRLTASGVCEVT